MSGSVLIKTNDIIRRIPAKEDRRIVVDRECLLPGAIDSSAVTLITMDKPVKNGLQIG
jgi:hypothetical protein